jgi:hypothetical protein
MTDPCRAALAELVALKDLKDRCARHNDNTRSGREVHQAMIDDYLSRKPLAWEAARAALAQPVVPPSPD